MANYDSNFPVPESNVSLVFRNLKLLMLTQLSSITRPFDLDLGNHCGVFTKSVESVSVAELLNKSRRIIIEIGLD